MFVLTLRKGGLKKMAAVVVCAAALCGSVMGLSALMKDDEAAQTMAAPKSDIGKIVSAEEVSNFLKGYGVEIDMASAQVNSVKVPKKWDDSFKAFNDIIKEGGLDLSKSKNKKVDKWMALVPALCENEEKAYAVVLISNEKAVGAYIIKKPSGDVSALKAVQASTPLTQEELAANADFDSESLIVTDGAAATGAQAVPADEAAMPTE